MDLKIKQSLLERVQIYKNAAKPKNLWELKDFFLKNSRQFNCSGSTRDSCTNITKQKIQLWIIQLTTQYESSGVNFLMGSHFINSNLIFSCGLLNVNIFYVKYLIQVSTK